VVMALGYRPDPGLAGLLAGPPAEGLPAERPSAGGIPDRRWQASGILSDRARAYAHDEPVGRLALRREAGLAASAVPLRDGLWAAGDALTGPSTVAEAMAQGRRAAAAVIAAA